MADITTSILPRSSRTKREAELSDFAALLKKISTTELQGVKLGARGWCYLLEGKGHISKAEFDKVGGVISECRKKGYLDIRFTADHEARDFVGVEEVEHERPEMYFKNQLLRVYDYAARWYTPDWWQDEKYYIQMFVEKIDLRNLFAPICQQYHIPITNSVGFPDINQRADAADRFREAEEKGLEPVLLVFGDYDIHGEIIRERYKKGFEEISGGTYWHPRNLIIDPFGLDRKTIDEYNLTWIEGLTTSSGKDMTKGDLYKQYKQRVDDWIYRNRDHYGGKAKVEANAIVARPDVGRRLCREAIERYLGDDALARFRAKQEHVTRDIDAYKSREEVKRFFETVRSTDDGEHTAEPTL